MPQSSLFNRRLALGAFACATGLLLVAGCGGNAKDSAGGAGAAPMPKVKLAKTSATGLQQILVDIANKEGFFKKRNVNVEVVVLTGDAGSIPALTSGSVEFAVSTSTPFFAAAKKTDKIEIVAPISSEPPAQVVINKNVAQRLGITGSTPVDQKVKALKGLKVAVLDVGGGLQYTLNAMLTGSGIQPKEVQVSAISPYSTMLAALRKGDVDAAAPAVPYGYMAVEQGDGVMLADVWGGDVPSIKNLYFTLLNVNADYAKKNPAVVQAVKDSMADAMNYVHTNPDGAFAVAKGLLPKFPDSVLKEVLAPKSAFPTTTEITEKDFQDMAAFAKASGVDPSGVKLATSIWKK